MPVGFQPVPRRMNYGRPSWTKFGPWNAGLVNRYVPELLKADALEQCDNFDVFPDGELKVRGRIQNYAVTGMSNTTAPKTQTNLNYNLVGSFAVVGAGGVTNYFVHTVWNNTTNNYTITVTAFLGNAFNGGYTVYGNATAYTTLPSYAFVYNGIIYIGIGSSSTAVTFSTSARTWSTQAGMPSTATVGLYSGNDQSVIAQDMAVLYKDRVFILSGGGAGTNNNSRIYYSKALSATVWSGDPDTGFFDVEPIDNEGLNCMVATRSRLYFFKDRSIFALSYTNNPTDGRLDLLSRTTGGSSAVVYENTIYFVTGDYSNVYALLNNNISLISYGISDGSPAFGKVKLVAEGLIFGGASSIYCYNLKSRAFSTYSINTTDVDVLNNVSVARTIGGYQLVWISNAGRFYAWSILNTSITYNKESYVKDDGTMSNSTVKAMLTTRDYDAGILSVEAWKRVYLAVINLYYNYDARCAGDCSGSIECIINDPWNYTKAQLQGQPAGNGVTVTENLANVATINYSWNVSAATKTVPFNSFYQANKFYSSIRTKRFSYTITVYDTGNDPVSLYELSSLVKTKAPVGSAAAEG